MMTNRFFFRRLPTHLKRPIWLSWFSRSSMRTYWAGVGVSEIPGQDRQGCDQARPKQDHGPSKAHDQTGCQCHWAGCRHGDEASYRRRGISYLRALIARSISQVQESQAIPGKEKASSAGQFKAHWEVPEGPKLARPDRYWPYYYIGRF